MAFCCVTYFVYGKFHHFFAKRHSTPPPLTPCNKTRVLGEMSQSGCLDNCPKMARSQKQSFSAAIQPGVEIWISTASLPAGNIEKKKGRLHRLYCIGIIFLINTTKSVFQVEAYSRDLLSAFGIV